MRKPIAVALALTLLLLLVLPTTVLAKTKWDLEGWRVDAGKWMDGLLFTWYEDNDVPYRLEANGYDGLDTRVVIQHDYLDASNHYGIDEAKNFFIGETTDRITTPESITAVYTPGTVFDVVGPTIVPVPNGYIQEWEFQITDPDALKTFNDGNWAFYWEAHLALTGSPGITFGSSYWNGASLHAHTSVTGHQDVPIKTPPQEGPPPEPCIEVMKEVSVDGGDTWDDANTEPGPEAQWDSTVQFRITVHNCGNTDLRGIILTDELYKDNELIESSIITNKTTLAPDEYDIVYWSHVASGCQYENVVTAIGVCAVTDTEVRAVDSAWFYLY